MVFLPAMVMEPSFYERFLQICKGSLWFSCQQWVGNPRFTKVSCRCARNPYGFPASNGYGTLVLGRFPGDLQGILMVFLPTVGREPLFYQGFLEICKESYCFLASNGLWNPRFTKVSFRCARNPYGFLANNG